MLSAFPWRHLSLTLGLIGSSGCVTRGTRAKFFWGGSFKFRRLSLADFIPMKLCALTTSGIRQICDSRVQAWLSQAMQRVAREMHVVWSGLSQSPLAVRQE